MFFDLHHILSILPAAARLFGRSIVLMSTFFCLPATEAAVHTFLLPAALVPPGSGRARPMQDQCWTQICFIVSSLPFQNNRLELSVQTNTFCNLLGTKEWE
jgi:hypothetical protein